MTTTMNETYEPTLPDGHVLTCSADRARRLGYWLARDAKGYEYVVGAHHKRLPDGSSESVRTDADGKRRTWLCTAAGGYADTSPDRVAETWSASVPAKLRTKSPWVLADGTQPDSDGIRGAILSRVRGWAQTYLAKSHRLSVWLQGAPGVGKSQVVAWAGADLAAGGVRSEREDWPDLVRRLRSTYGQDGESRRDFEARVRELILCPVLFLDDVGAECSADDGRALLYQIIDGRLAGDRVTFATSNVRLDRVGAALREGGLALDPRLSSRLSGYTAMTLEGRDYRAKAKLL